MNAQHPSIVTLEPRILGPCARPGQHPDWWHNQHVSCTGSEYVRDGAGGIVEIRCSCDCGHGGKKPEPKPEPKKEEA